MTFEEHKARHLELHKALDELAGDFLLHNKKSMLSTTGVMELVHWSYIQTESPDGSSHCKTNY